MSESDKSFTVVHFWRGARQRRPRWNLGDPPKKSEVSGPARPILLAAAIGGAIAAGLWLLTASF